MWKTTCLPPSLGRSRAVALATNLITMLVCSPPAPPHPSAQPAPGVLASLFPGPTLGHLLQPQHHHKGRHRSAVHRRKSWGNLVGLVKCVIPRDIVKADLLFSLFKGKLLCLDTVKTCHFFRYFF